MPSSPISLPPAASTPVDHTETTPPAPRRNLVVVYTVKLRWTFFILVAALNLAAWNGQWRMSRDSALYRAVAQSLVDGKGYTFRGEVERHAYPGLPLMLAGLEQLFPSNDVLQPRAALLVIFTMGMLSLVMIYRLVRLHFDEWIAVAVTCGVGANRIFVSHAQELLTDVPFLFGVCAAVLGYEELLRATSRNRPPAPPDSAPHSKTPYARLLAATLLTLVGLVTAASMRPTFYALAAAWLGAAIWGLFRIEKRDGTPSHGDGEAPPPRSFIQSPRFAHAIALALLLALATLFLILNQRTRGVMWGQYEQQAADKVGELADVTWAERLRTMFDEHVPDIFFGTALVPGFNSLISIAVLASAVWLFRYRRLWGLYAAATVVMTLLVANNARYFLMLLPFMLLGWALVAKSIADRFSRFYFVPEIVLWLGLAIVWLPNTIRSMGIVAEQQGITRDGVKPFVEAYRNGEMDDLVQLGRAIRNVPGANAKILAPEPRILSFLSGRNVYAAEEFLKERKRVTARAQIKAFGFTHAVFPAELYKDKDPAVRKLMQDGYLHPTPIRRRRVTVGEMMLAPLVIEESPAAVQKWLRESQPVRREIKPDDRLTPPPASAVPPPGQ